jgi:spore coat polysaccharide biosynthesis protein SpsF (cytidylyltransferase family)
MKLASEVDTKMFLATTYLEEDRILFSKCQCPNIEVFGGHPSDLIERFKSIATKDNLKIICRLTGDNPFIDYSFIRYSIEKLLEHDFENPTIVTSRGGDLAPGLDVESFNIAALTKASIQSDEYDREHITSGMSESKGFNVIRISGEQIHKEYPRLTVDFEADLAIARNFAVKFDLDHRSVKNFKIRDK